MILSEIEDSADVWQILHMLPPLGLRRRAHLRITFFNLTNTGDVHIIIINDLTYWNAIFTTPCEIKSTLFLSFKQHFPLD